MSMRDDCRRYVINCSTCRRSKAYNDRKQRLLAPLSIPQRKWTDLSLDFVVKLSKCHRRGRMYENILIIVDRLIKRRLYEPIADIGTKDVLCRSSQTSGLFNVRPAILHRPRSQNAIDSLSVEANLSATESQIETVLRASSRNR